MHFEHGGKSRKKQRKVSRLLHGGSNNYIIGFPAVRILDQEICFLYGLRFEP
jgi:hypothetical protein